MPHNMPSAIETLNRRFFLDYPVEAARRLEQLPSADVARLLASYPTFVTLPVWERLAPDVCENIVQHMDPGAVRKLFTEMDPTRSSTLLSQMDKDTRAQYLHLLPGEIAAELQTLMSYPPGSAGHSMNPRVMTFREEMTAREALARLRGAKRRIGTYLFLADSEGILKGMVMIQSLATAQQNILLQALEHPVTAVVDAVASREEVVEKLERYKLSELPVVDAGGRLLGTIRYDALVTAIQEEASADIQTMVGVSKDERALSSVGFAVRKRLPWLEINLLTAFLAAAVVGLFEETIARFTALAVLLPVVAGQSGNTGAQALAVTMRGLALREIRITQWLRVLLKEVNVGLLNGIAIALTTSLGVYLWSRSFGLALVIGSAMVLSMIAAGFSGALIPIGLTKLGQDPAQSSSIILTTVTDVVGFMTFLGIGTLLAGML